MAVPKCTARRSGKSPEGLPQAHAERAFSSSVVLNRAPGIKGLRPDHVTAAGIHSGSCASSSGGALARMLLREDRQGWAPRRAIASGACERRDPDARIPSWRVWLFGYLRRIGRPAPLSPHPRVADPSDRPLKRNGSGGEIGCCGSPRCGPRGRVPLRIHSVRPPLALAPCRRWQGESE
jgi:hypothetical protein